MKHHIIYVPGFGDYDSFRRRVLSVWRLYGVSVDYIPMRWYDGRSYQEREDRVKYAVARAKKSGKTVSLVSESAGGALALNVFAGDPEINRLVSICAVNNPDAPIHPRILDRSPAFGESLKKLKSRLIGIDASRRQDIVVLTSVYDPVVSLNDSNIYGVKPHRIFAFGHLVTIFTILVFYGYWVTRFVTRPKSR